MKQRLLCLVTCVLTLALVAGAAHAFAPNAGLGLVPYNFDYVGTWANHNIECQTWRKNQPGCQPSAQSPGTHSSVRTQALPRGVSVASLNTGKPFATTMGIERMVAHYPAQYQQQITKTFTTLISTFDQTIPRTYGIPANNLASAYAAVLAGSYAAYTNRPFPENAVKPLFKQVQQGMLNNPQTSQVSMDEKNAMYQIWVGTGMYLLGWQAELAKHPDPQQQAKMQKAGADALRAALGGADPSRVRFTASGMQMH